MGKAGGGAVPNAGVPNDPLGVGKAGAGGVEPELPKAAGGNDDGENAAGGDDPKAPLAVGNAGAALNEPLGDGNAGDGAPPKTGALPVGNVPLGRRSSKSTSRSISSGGIDGAGAGGGVGTRATTAAVG